MRQNIYILYDEQTEYVTNAICEKLHVDGKIYSMNSELTTSILAEISANCYSEYFYIIKTDKEILFPNFNFTYKPEKWNSEYVGIWNDEITLRIFNTKKVLDDPSKFNDENLESGSIKLKSLFEKIYVYPSFEIIFLSYDEEHADISYKKLIERFPKARRIHNVKGIFEAHKSAAELAAQLKSDMFYVVDADAELISTFEFDYQPHSLDRNSVHVWHSINAVNDLIYGYGGVKLFPTESLLSYNGTPIDFTTTVSKNFKVVEEVSNITKFNTDPFSAWRSGFRECVKLSSKIILNQDNGETENRLRDWCIKGEDRLFGDFAIAGALEGAEYGRLYSGQPNMLELINDYEWLEKKFNS